jgi:hypothetical protein
LRFLPRDRSRSGQRDLDKSLKYGIINSAYGIGGIAVNKTVNKTQLLNIVLALVFIFSANNIVVAQDASATTVATDEELEFLTNRLRAESERIDTVFGAMFYLEYREGALRQYITVTAFPSPRGLLIYRWYFIQETWQKDAAGRDVVDQWIIHGDFRSVYSNVEHHILVFDNSTLVESTFIPETEEAALHVARQIVKRFMKPRDHN